MKQLSERDADIVARREAGETFAAIGRRHGISGCRAKVICDHRAWELSHAERPKTGYWEEREAGELFRFDLWHAYLTPAKNDPAPGWMPPLTPGVSREMIRMMRDIASSIEAAA